MQIVDQLNRAIKMAPIEGACVDEIRKAREYAYNERDRLRRIGRAVDRIEQALDCSGNPVHVPVYVRRNLAIIRSAVNDGIGEETTDEAEAKTTQDGQAQKETSMTLIERTKAIYEKAAALRRELYDLSQDYKTRAEGPETDEEEAEELLGDREVLLDALSDLQKAENALNF